MIRARVNSQYPQRFLPPETWSQGNTCDVQPERRPSNLDRVGTSLMMWTIIQMTVEPEKGRFVLWQWIQLKNRAQVFLIMTSGISYFCIMENTKCGNDLIKEMFIINKRGAQVTKIFPIRSSSLEEQEAEECPTDLTSCMLLLASTSRTTVRQYSLSLSLFVCICMDWVAGCRKRKSHPWHLCVHFEN